MKNHTVSPKKKKELKEKLAILGDKAYSVAVFYEHEAIEKKVTQLCAEFNRDVVNLYFGCTDDIIEGFPHANTWSLMKELLQPRRIKIEI